MSINFDFHYETADLIEKRFVEGLLTARGDRETGREDDSECPYQDEYEKRWWTRGYQSEGRRMLLQAGLLLLHDRSVDILFRKHP
jgi:hypothetical protein